MSLALPTGSTARQTVVEHLRTGARRRILGVLLERPTPLPVAELADRAVEESDREASDLHVELVHVHLPKLAETGLVEWNREAGTVATTDHPAFADPDLRRLVDRADEDWDDVVDCLADGRRRAVLAVLGEHEEPVARRALALAVAVREADGEPAPEAIEEVRVALYHAHLPKLADAGLVADDGEEVTARDHRAVEPLLAFCGDE